MALLGWFDGELRPDAWFDAELNPQGWFDTEIIDTVAAGGGVTGTGATAQAQTIAATGTAAPQAITGTGTTSQAQTIAASGAFTAMGVAGVGATSQAQTASGSGSAAPQSVSGIGSTSQAQRIAATGATAPQAVSGTAATSQAQTVSGTGSANPQAASGTGATSQAQTVSGSGSFAGASGVTGVSSTSQAQTSSGSGSVVNPEAPSSAILENLSYPSPKNKKTKAKPLGGHYWKPEELAQIEPLVTKQPIAKLPAKEPEPITPKPRINRLNSVVSAHKALADIGIQYKQVPVDYSQVINALQIEIQRQKDDDDYAIATLMAMLL